MRQIRTLSLALLVFGLIASIGGSAMAADLKIGILDVQYVLHNSASGGAIKKKLEKIFKKKQKELDKAQKELLSLKEKLENPSDMMTEDRYKEMVGTYQKGLMALQEKFMKQQQELQAKEVELMKPLLSKLEKVLNSIAEKENYDLIMNRSEHGVLFAKKTFDISDKVLKKLDGK